MVKKRIRLVMISHDAANFCISGKMFNSCLILRTEFIEQMKRKVSATVAIMKKYSEILIPCVNCSNSWLGSTGSPCVLENEVASNEGSQ